MARDIEEKTCSLQENLQAFENSFVSSAPAAQKKQWKKLRANIEAMLLEAKPPYASRAVQQPLILVATPEIVSLPPNMGNLANVITTGDGGGLADISSSLVTELDRQGVNVHVALPEYRHLFEIFADISHDAYETLKHEINDQDRIHLIEDDMFSVAKRVYGDSGPRLDKIDLRRANAFQRGIISRLFPMLKKQHKHILVHCNDWMTGLLPAAAKSQDIRSLMTFHNIFTYYQWPKGLQKHSIDVEPFWKYLYFRHHPDGFDGFAGNYEHNEVDFMTSGLFAADFINTVSPTFLKEIVEGYFAEHHIIPDTMRSVIRNRYAEGCAAGILNAPAITADPRNDPMIVQRYGFDDARSLGVTDVGEGKRRNKQFFQEETDLNPSGDTPLFFWPSRIARPQKGFELMLRILPSLMREFDMQISVVANGDMELIHQMERFQHQFPGRISYRPFSRELNQTGKAAADFILMPSLYEPCGIPQVEAPRYGTIPIVRRTGGLADTIEDLSVNGLMGNGFVFDDYLPSGLWHGISRALIFYGKEESFRLAVQKRIMKESFEKFNIEKTAKRYIEVYGQILRRVDPKLKVV